MGSAAYASCDIPWFIEYTDLNDARNCATRVFGGGRIRPAKTVVRITEDGTRVCCLGSETANLIKLYAPLTRFMRDARRPGYWLSICLGTKLVIRNSHSNIGGGDSHSLAFVLCHHRMGVRIVGIVAYVVWIIFPRF
jgi:hypothetical protein